MTHDDKCEKKRLNWPGCNCDTRTDAKEKPLSPSDATACSSVEFRLLNRADIIDPNDEFLTDDCQTWARVGDEALKFMIGKPYSVTFFQPMRRKTYPTNSELSQP